MWWSDGAGDESWKSCTAPTIPEYRYGGTAPATVGLTIGFSKKGAHIFANTLTFQSRAVQRTYGNRYRVLRGYGSNPGLGCTGTLRRRNAPSGLTFGINPYRPSRPYLEIRANAFD